MIENLSADTWYHIHVHALDPMTHQTIDGPTNIIIVKTAAAGSALEPLAPGSADYVICGGGDDGGGGGGCDDGCALITFTLQPGSEALPEVQVTLVDPSSGGYWTLEGARCAVFCVVGPSIERGAPLSGERREGDRR